jgi:hypothetical protein
LFFFDLFLSRCHPGVHLQRIASFDAGASSSMILNGGLLLDGWRKFYTSAPSLQQRRPFESLMSFVINIEL